MERITVKKVMEMLREEILYWEDNKPIPITRHTLPIEEVREY
jgi:hypothetical protein